MTDSTQIWRKIRVSGHLGIEDFVRSPTPNFDTIEFEDEADAVAFKLAVPFETFDDEEATRRAIERMRSPSETEFAVMGTFAPRTPKGGDSLIFTKSQSWEMPPWSRQTATAAIQPVVLGTTEIETLLKGSEGRRDG